MPFTGRASTLGTWPCGEPLSILWSLIVHDWYLSSGEDGYSWPSPLMTVMYSFDGTLQKPSHSCYLRVMGNNSYRVLVFISPSGDGCQHTDHIFVAILGVVSKPTLHLMVAVLYQTRGPSNNQSCITPRNSTTVVLGCRGKSRVQSGIRHPVLWRLSVERAGYASLDMTGVLLSSNIPFGSQNAVRL